MMKPWDDLDYLEKLAVAFNQGRQRYIQEYIEEQEKRNKVMAAVDRALSMGSRLFRRPRGK